MLVKFRTIRDTDIICLVDSKEIYCDKVNDENRIQRYKSKLSQYVLVDDATLAYLENAWLHEGMRRVAICVTKRIYIYNTPSSAWVEQKNEFVRSPENFGWYFDGRIINENGFPQALFEEIVEDSKKTTFTLTFRFITYETEEKK